MTSSAAAIEAAHLEANLIHRIERTSYDVYYPAALAKVNLIHRIERH